MRKVISLINWLIDDTKHVVRAELKPANAALTQITHHLKYNSERQMPSKLKLRPTTHPDGTSIAVHAAPDNSAWRASHREAILEPELPIIDPHHHLWNRKGWMYEYSEFLNAILDGHSIRSTVFIQCRATDSALNNRASSVLQTTTLLLRLRYRQYV